jgi:hypothetical protein
MPNSDFLPRQEAKFYEWVVTFFSYLIVNLQRFGIAESMMSGRDLWLMRM